MREKMKVKCHYDVVVVGGGLSGVCAAIACARHGAKTALVQNRPVLGGNASSEVRMHICSAGQHNRRPDARETGIIEELQLEHKKRNPQNSFSIWETVLWEKTHFQDGLDLFLNTHMTDVVMKDNTISGIIAEQQTTEKIFHIDGKIFIDATGDATLGYLAGAEYMLGRDGKDVYGEKYAPEHSDKVTMGNSLFFKAVDAGKPVPFEKPFWANTYTEEDLAYRSHQEMDAGYWWIELGGDELDIIYDGEKIRDELLKAVYGVWDHIKNSGHHKAENLVLDWVQFLPGKRESRRLVGDYVLTEHDLFDSKIFDDAVAYGGWHMDMHVPGGLRSATQEPTDFINVKDLYTIPYRSLYSKNIPNLMLGGRAFSVSRMAFGSTRVMATCAVVGQAIGTAAALAIHKGITPRAMLSHIRELQLNLMNDDCFIPGFKNEDEHNLAKSAALTCSSSIEGCSCENVTNGYARILGRTRFSETPLGSVETVYNPDEASGHSGKIQTNCWVSEKMQGSEWITLKFPKVISPKEVVLVFDSNLSKEITISVEQRVLRGQVSGPPLELVKDYAVEFYLDDRLVHSLAVKGNYLRQRKHQIENQIECNQIKINVLSTYGDQHARIFEVRVY